MRKERPALQTAKLAQVTLMNEFLEQQVAQGHYDSTDVFTLDTLRMGRKMAASQFTERGLWLVKLVQAAAALQASDFRVRFQRRKVRVSFSTLQVGPTAQELLHGIFRPATSAPRALDHMLTGLRTCVAADTEHLGWEVRGPEGGGWVQLTPSATQAGLAESRDQAGWTYTFELERPATRLPFKKALRQRCVDLVREVGDEYVAVLSRCWCAPFTLHLDGVDMETGLPHPAMRHLSDCRIVGCGVDRYHMGDHWLALRPLCVNGTSTHFPEAFLRQLTTASEFEISDPVKPKECFLRWPQMDGCNALLLLSFSSLAQPGIDFILDGAVIDQVDFPYPRPLRATDKLLPVYQRQAVGFRLFVTVDSHQVDLSGFAIREKEQLATSLFEQVRVPLLDTIAQLEKYLDHYRFAPAKVEKRNRWLDRVLAPMARLNQGFIKTETRRTLEQLRVHVKER